MIVASLLAFALAAGAGGEPSDWWIVGRDGPRWVLIDKDSVEREIRTDTSTYVTFVDPGADEPIRQQFVGYDCRRKTVYFGMAMYFAADGSRLRTDGAPQDAPKFDYLSGDSFALLCAHTDPADASKHIGNVGMSGLVRARAKPR
ncbi:MAG TPA: hypothetical protein VGL66_01470 [Caulobacteraceae bacterium]